MLVAPSLAALHDLLGAFHLFLVRKERGLAFGGGGDSQGGGGGGADGSGADCGWSGSGGLGNAVWRDHGREMRRPVRSHWEEVPSYGGK
jgi:hypothetical protein